MAPLDIDDLEVSPGGIAVRLRRAERDIETKASQKDLDTVVSEIQSLRRTLFWLIGTIAVAAVTMSLTLFATVGTHLG